MNKIMLFGIIGISISCASGIQGPSALDQTHVEPYNPLPTITTKIGVPDNGIPSVQTNNDSTHDINIHVISSSDGRVINQAEISMDGVYLGNTGSNGILVARDLIINKEYNFTIYHGQYLTSHEKHTITKEMTDFTSLLTRIY